MKNKKESGLFSLFGRSREREGGEDAMKYLDSFTKLPNGYQLEKDFAAMESRAGYDFVHIWIKGIHQMATLFNFEVTEQTFLRLCPFLRDFAERYHGRLYRLSLDRFSLLAQVENQRVFADDLAKLLADMEHVNVQDRHAEYSCHYTFSYSVYPMTPAENRIDSIGSVLSATSAAIDRLSRDNETVGTVFTDDSRPKWELRGKLEGHAGLAWEKREFVPYYQMVYDLKSERPVGAETLTRWKHPELGLIMPGDFLPVMESEGLIMDLDLYMLEEACRKIKGWVDNELVTVPLSVNISKLNIHRRNFVERLVGIVEKYDVPPILLELELSEGILIFEKNRQFLEIMRRLHDYGFSLSMDNFASSDFSSVNLLRDLELDVVKLSPRFFDQVDGRTENRDSIFVRGVIDVAKRLGIRLVAMGVETADQAELVAGLGCDCAQGYYFSRPVSNEEFEKQIF